MESDDILFVHSEVAEPGRFGYVEEISDAEDGFAATDHFVTFIGHTHHPLMFEQLPYGAVNLLPDEDRELDPKCRYIVNVGSAGEPRNPDDIRARYVIYDSDTRNIYFRRVDFDANAYRRDLDATTLTQVPFFLQVLDHTTGIEAAKAQDMEVPAQALQGFNTAQRTLVVPTTIASGTKPKPLPASAASPGGKSAGMIFTIVLVIAALLVGAGGISWGGLPT